jgi:putative oxidoreductase
MSGPLRGKSMTRMDSFNLVWTPRLRSVLRVITGFLLMAHGAQKLLNYPPSPQGGAVEIFSLMGFAGALELVGGFLIMIGLFTRVTAFILSGEMAVAYFMAHAPGGFLPLVNKGEQAVLYCFVFFYMATAGGGSWSVDRLLGRGAGVADSEIRAAKT